MDDSLTDKSSSAATLPAELANHPDFEIVRTLGGGTGVLYLTRNRLMGRLEVLRVIGPEIIGRPGVRDHFLREIRSVARLRHPNIVTAYSGFRAGESLVFATEYAEGLDLGRLVKASGPLPVAHACSFIHQAALGLQHAHRAGLVHRDLKPANLILTRKGDRAIVKVLDFGLAKAGREEGAMSVYGLVVPDDESPASVEGSSTPRQMTSTPDFIAPEQITNAHAADIRADIYSLGCTLYFLLSGRPPFEGATVHDVLQAQHSMNALPLNRARPDVPAELAALVAKAMSKDPDERFQTPEELARALAPFWKNRPIAGGHVNLEGSSPAASGQAPGPTPPAHAALTNLATPDAAVGDVTAIWSNLIDLIDLTELPDDSDDDPAGDPSRTRRYAVAATAGLAAVLLLFGLVVGLRELKSRSARRDLTRADTPAASAAIFAQSTTASAPSQGLSGETPKIAEARPEVAIVDSKVSRHTESNPVPKAEPPLVLTLEQKNAPAVVSSLKPRASVAGRKPANSPNARDVREIALFTARSRVLQARLLPDNRRVVYESGGAARALWVGDLDDQAHPRQLKGDPAGWKRLAFSADGRLALAFNIDNTLTVWDIETGTSRSVRSRDRAGIDLVALSPDNRRAVYFAGDAMHVRDLLTNRVNDRFGRFDSPVKRVAFRRDSRAIVTAHVDRTIRVSSLENTREGPAIANQSDVTDLAVFPDGQRVLASYSDGSVGVWDLNTGRKLREFVVAANGRFGDKSREEVVAVDGVVSASLSFDGQRALFASGNLMLLWDMETGEELQRVNHPGKVVHAAFSPDGARAVSIDDSAVRVWELPPARKPGEQPPMIEIAHYFGDERNATEWACVSPDGRRILTCGWPDRVRVFDRATGLAIRLDNLGAAALAISPDGQHVLSAHGGDKVLKLWELSSGKVVQELPGHTESIFSLAFSRDGHLAYSTSGGKEAFVDGSDPAIRVWDLAAGSQIGRLEGHKGIVRSVAVSPDGRRVLSSGWSDMTLILWDAESGRLLRRLTGHTGKVCSAAFLPGGRHAVSGGEDATVRLWDLDTGKQLDRILGPYGLGWMAVSPDGRRLLSSSFWSRELCLWDLEKKKFISRINFGGVPPDNGSFAPDARHAVWGGSDGVVRMYRLTEFDQGNRAGPEAAGTGAATAPRKSR